MWGTPHIHYNEHSQRRFIPTHVGNTPHTQLHTIADQVHPHACGEHESGGDDDALGAGSSPRMWGTLSEGVGIEPGQRFIPTHVGNTGMVSLVAACAPVHPHACGEHTKVVALL